MSNFQRAGGFRGHGDHQNQGSNSRGPNAVNRNNGLFNRNAPNRMNPWEGGLAPGCGNNMGNPNMGNLNMNNHNMGNLGSHNMGNSSIGCNRPPGGLLPTPNIPSAGLLQQPSIQDVQLAVASNVLNLLLPNMQASQQQNQMPLLGMNPGRGLLSPPLIGPFQNQNFGGQGQHGPSGNRQDNLGPNRGRSNNQARRSEPYNKMGNRNQRPGQNNNDRKGTSNVSHGAARGPGPNAKNATQQARNIKEEKGDGRRNQKTDSTSNDKMDKATDIKGKKDNENRTEMEKTKASFVDIPSDMFMCHVCNKNMWDAVSFINHVKGKAHQNMMQRQEESYKIKTDLMRHEMKVEEQQRQIANEKKQRQGKSVAAQPQEYCTMCNLHFNGHLTAHRKSNRHQTLKSFLHPKCEVCQKEFATRIDWDQHVLTAGHLKVAASKRQKIAGNQNKQLRREEDKHKSNKQKDEKLEVMVQENKSICHEPSNQKTETGSVNIQEESNVQKSDVKSETVSKKPNIESFVLSPKAATQVEVNREDLSSSSVLDQGNIPNYDSQRELGMEMLQEKTGYLCRCCNRFLSSSTDAKTHCRSQFHYEKYIAYLNSKATPTKSSKTMENEKSPSNKEESKEEKNREVVEESKNQEEEINQVEETYQEEETNQEQEKNQEVVEPEEEEEDEEDEGNWKRRKIAKEEDAESTFQTGNNEEQIRKEDENRGEYFVPKGVDDEQVPVDAHEDTAAKDTANLSVKQEEEQDTCDDLEKTILLEETPSRSVARRGRVGSTRSRGRKKK